MKRIRLTPAAQADIEGIWDYTEEHWSADQADRYTDGIRDACLDVASGRKEGRKATVRSGYLKFLVGAHILYYRVEGDTIIIVRILHSRMDADQHLN